jgi:hypothetical protein
MRWQGTKKGVWKNILFWEFSKSVLAKNIAANVPHIIHTSASNGTEETEETIPSNISENIACKLYPPFRGERADILSF